MLSHSSTIRVRYAETDQMGWVYHANYLVWMEIARTDLIRSYGITYADLERDGYALAVAELTIRYRAPAKYDDEIVTTAVLRDVRSRSLRIDYEIMRPADNTHLATGYTALVSIDPKTLRPVALPPAVTQLFGGPASADAGTPPDLR